MKLFFFFIALSLSVTAKANTSDPYACIINAANAVETLYKLNGKSTSKIVQEVNILSTKSSLGMEITDYQVLTSDGLAFKVKIAPDNSGNCITLAVGAHGYIR